MQQRIKPLKSQKFSDLNTCWVGFKLIPAKKSFWVTQNCKVSENNISIYLWCLHTNIRTSFCRYGIMPRKLATFHFFCQLMVMGARLDVHKYKLAHFIHHVPVFLHRGSIHHSCLSWRFLTKIFPAGAVLKNIVTKGTDEKNLLLWYQQIFMDFFTRIFHGEIQSVCTKIYFYLLVRQMAMLRSGCSH